MNHIVVDTEAGQLSAALRKRGIDAAARAHAIVELLDPHDLTMATIAQAGKAFDFLAEEPDLYSDSDLAPRQA